MSGAVILALIEAASSRPSVSQALRDAVACPAPKAGEVVVCAPSDPPWRLPLAARDPGFQMDGPRDSVSRERHKLMDVGGAGALQNACTPVGASGWTGCMVKEWREAEEQRGFRPRR